MRASSVVALAISLSIPACSSDSGSMTCDATGAMPFTGTWAGSQTFQMGSPQSTCMFTQASPAPYTISVQQCATHIDVQRLDSGPTRETMEAGTADGVSFSYATAPTPCGPTGSQGLCPGSQAQSMSCTGFTTVSVSGIATETTMQGSRLLSVSYTCPNMAPSSCSMLWTISLTKR